MSIVAQVLFQSKAKDTAHHLLMVLAVYNDLYGSESHPSVATLAKHIDKIPRYTHTLLQRLEAEGHLAVRRVRIEGQRPQNFYTVLTPAAQSTASENTALQSTASETTAESVSVFCPALEVKKKKTSSSTEKTLLPTPVLSTPVLSTAPDALPIDPGDPDLHRGLRLLSAGGLLARDVAASVGIVLPQETAPAVTPAPPSRSRPRRRGARAKILLSAKTYLGKLCPRGHRYEGQDGSERRLPGGSCVECNKMGTKRA